MLFDIRTLLVAVALANVFSTGARFLLWRMHPGIPGLGRWALGGVFAVLAFALLVTYKISPWQPFIALAQIVVVLGLLLTWDGFRRFIEQPPLSRLTIAVITAIVLAWAVVVAQIQHSQEAMALGNAALITVFSVLIARELLGGPKPILFAMRATGWAYAANATVFLTRIVFTDHGIHTTTVDPLNPDGIAAYMLLWWLCVTIATTLGMVLMTSERLQADLDDQANRDPLTGALNRRSFTLFTEKAMAQSRRHAQPLSILVMDLDDFKQINDRLGHDAGDMMLRFFVNISDEVLRSDDIFCRYGGEEFVALLPNTSAEQALVTAKRLCSTFAAGTAAEMSNDIQPVTVSIGIADLGQNEDFESLFRRADIALYQAKDNGRNCCQLAENTDKKHDVLHQPTCIEQS
jgi:diguanylate cyclase (GGDEF)-like protein